MKEELPLWICLIVAAAMVGVFIAGAVKESWQLLAIGYVGLMAAMVCFGKFTINKRA